MTAPLDAGEQSATQGAATQGAVAQGTATIFVCVSCRRKRDGSEDGSEEAFDLPGPALVEALEQCLADTGVTGLTVTPIECLAVCKRPCTVALCGSEKWTYLVGDLDPETHVEEIVAAALSYARSDNGIVPWKERPQTFRKGVVARIPPLGFVHPKPETPETP